MFLPFPTWHFNIESVYQEFSQELLKLESSKMIYLEIIGLTIWPLALVVLRSLPFSVVSIIIWVRVLSETLPVTSFDLGVQMERDLFYLDIETQPRCFHSLFMYLFLSFFSYFVH